MSAQTTANPADDAHPPADREQPTAPPAGGSIKQRAKRGAIILILSQFVGQFFRLASNLVLTRLLMPEAFGLMAIVNIYIAGINMFSDLGIKPSIVQNKLGDDPRFLNTAWTIQVIRGVGVWAVACLLAYPLAYGLYDKPILMQLLPVAALSSIFLGFQSTKLHTAARHLQLGREMALLLGSQLTGLILMGVLAYIYRSVWALVLGTLTISVLTSVLSHFVFPGPKNRFCWDRAALSELVNFGKWIFFGTVVMFLATNIDRLLLSTLITTEMLGIYQIAFMITSMPNTLIKRFGNKVVFPAVSRRADIDRGVLNQKLLQNQKRLALVMVLPVMTLVCAGDWIVRLGWEGKFEQAGWMASILGFGLWMAMLRAPVGPALLAIGKPQYQFYANIGSLLWSALVATGGFYLYGMPGFLVAFALCELPAYLIVSIGIAKEKLSLWKQDVKLTALLLLAIAAVLAGRYALGWGLPFVPASG